MRIWAPSLCKVFCSIFLIVGVVELSAAQTSISTSHTSVIFRTQLSTGNVIFDTLRGTQLQSAAQLPSTPGSEGRLIGASVSETGINKLIYFNSVTRAITASLYGGATHETSQGSVRLTTLGAGWVAQAVGDFAHDGSFGVIATDSSNGEAAAYFFGGSLGTSFLKKESINGLSASGYRVFGAADLNGDGHTDLLLQNSATQQVMVAYLGGANGLSVVATHNLESSTFTGWTAAGMQDMNGDGHPDLILVNNKTGESIVNYYAGEMGFAYVGSAYLDPASARGWSIVVPVSGTASTSTSPSATTLAASATTASPTATSTSPTPLLTSSSSATVLIYNGSGTSSGDVAAVESLVGSMGLSYHTANQSQLNSMSTSALLAYRLFLMPGGNAISISSYISKTATANLHNAISSGLNYLGFCAGGFFAGSSAYYNYTNLTNGVWFNVWSNFGRGIGATVARASFPNGSTMDMYWQNGPALDHWGSVVAKYANGDIAITEGFEGKGFVLLCGLHPEAPASWRTGMNFGTSLDVDLAYARSLVTSALNRSMQPHF